MKSVEVRTIVIGGSLSADFGVSDVVLVIVDGRFSREVRTWETFAAFVERPLLLELFPLKFDVVLISVLVRSNEMRKRALSSINSALDTSHKASVSRSLVGDFNLPGTIDLERRELLCDKVYDRSRGSTSSSSS